MSKVRVLMVVGLLLEHDDPVRLHEIAGAVRDVLDPPAESIYLVTDSVADAILDALHSAP